ncbi:GumC family protein [Geomonas sp. RF6]|uniref:GumC family protein n=1 Tax=Geomonas sp. RF6 TaxID=2897342 RepID=UPI001E564526|nr:GNVR domain-containing protein [Geomonas sp. RF6]UFS69336.1 GumC family protein [Geomonas sp. RF6]
MEKSSICQHSHTRSLRELLTVLFKHKWQMLTVLLAVVGTVMIVTFFRSPIYEGKSSVLVKIGREYLNNPGVGDNKAIMSLNQEELINSEIEILTQPDLIRKVIVQLRAEHLDPQLSAGPAAAPPSEEAIASFRRGLNVEGIKKSNVILVSFRHKDPRVAARGVNLLVQYYTEKHLQVFSDPKSAFLEQQLAMYEQKLSQSENTLQDFKRKNSVFSLDEQRTLLLKQRTDLDTSWKYAQDAVQELKRKIGTLSGQMHGVSSKSGLYTNSERDSIIVQAKSNLLALQLKERELLKKYTEKNPLVEEVRNDIRMVQGFMREQEADISSKVKTGNAVYQHVEIELMKAQSELSSQSARAAALGQQLAQVDQEIRALDLNEKETQRLKRERAVDEKNYQAYRDRTEAARISDNMNRLQLADISVIQKATVPSKPVKPKKALNLVLAVMLGGICALGLAFFSEYTSQSFSFPEDAAEKLGIPLLATITYTGENWRPCRDIS